MNNACFGNTDINHTARLPFSQACEKNKRPILEVLKKEFCGYHHVLEVGSGTGQHSVYFAPRLSHLQWQTSDVMTNLYIIQAWHDNHPASNLHAPLAFDLRIDNVPKRITSNTEEKYLYDAIFTANTLHIIEWSLVERLFKLVGKELPESGKLIIYGPFNDNANYTSASNKKFDAQLRERDLKSGIRNKQDVVELAKQYHLKFSNFYEMPAHNQILVFTKV